MAESAKRSKKYPGMKDGMSMTAKMARGTVNPETRKKRAAAEAKRQAATEGAGGGRARLTTSKLVEKTPPKASRRGGQEMPTGGGGPGPKMPSKGPQRRAEMATAKPASKSAMAAKYGKKGASPQRGGPSGDTRVSGGGPISAKGGPVSVHDPTRLARMNVGTAGSRKRGVKPQAADPSQEGIRGTPKRPPVSIAAGRKRPRRQVRGAPQ